MKKTKEEKLEILNKISRPRKGKPKWQILAEWHEANEEQLKDRKVISSRIRQAMSLLDLSHEELARNLEIEGDELSDIIACRKDLTLFMIRRIEIVLCISLITVIT